MKATRGTGQGSAERVSEGLTLMDIQWGEPVGGLRCGLEVPGAAPRAGGGLRLGLHFRNVGSEPLRIYLLRTEHFRSFQSTVYVCEAATGEPLNPPEPSPGHGYVVDEDDFHLIPPGHSLRFEQGVPLDDEAVAAGGEYLVKWVYENTIAEWPGGVMTFDGPTKKLFGGKRIPQIWTGRAEASATLRVAGAAAPDAADPAHPGLEA